MYSSCSFRIFGLLFGKFKEMHKDAPTRPKDALKIPSGRHKDIKGWLRNARQKRRTKTHKDTLSIHRDPQRRPSFFIETPQDTSKMP